MVPTDEVNLVYLFPGQGAQEVGMGSGLWQRYDCVKKVFKMAEDIYGEPLRKICFDGPFREMRRTDRAQILIGVVNLSAFLVLRELGIEPDVVAGHSAGEISAAFAAGAIALEDTLRLISLRGKYMYEAALSSKGRMVAVLGVPEKAVADLVEMHRGDGDLSIGNCNAPTEHVVTGDMDRVTALERDVIARGVGSVVDLKQQGAWHSIQMIPAQIRFAEALKKTDIHMPHTPFLLNYSSEFAKDADDLRIQLSSILSSTVRWTSCLRVLASLRPRCYCECGHGKILRGLLRKNFRNGEMYQIYSAATPQSIEVFMRNQKRELVV
jgi:[acyl-carrier-protein] S-malonyltransferase